MNFFLPAPEGPANPSPIVTRVDGTLGISVMTSSGAEPTLMYSVEFLGEIVMALECLLRLRSGLGSWGGGEDEFRSNL
jgi:hypothetical protein